MNYNFPAIKVRYICDEAGSWHYLSASDEDGWWRARCGRRVFGTVEASAELPAGGSYCQCVYSTEEALAFHVVDKHCNTAGIHNRYADNLAFHHHDHFGPCGIRNHQYLDLSFDEDKLEQALEEVEVDLCEG